MTCSSAHMTDESGTYAIASDIQMSFAQQIIDGHIEFAPKNRLTESKGRESFHNLRYYAEPYLDCQKIFVYQPD